MTTQYHLISSKGSYWRPEGKGYTTDIHEAGVFDEGLARGIVKDTHGDHRMVEVAKPEEGSIITVVDLESALTSAIDASKAWEERVGYVTRSIYLAGLESNLAYLRAHGTLRIKP